MTPKCTFKFFENDLFQYKVLPLDGFKYYYKFPVISTWDKSFFSRKKTFSKESIEQYKQGFITHELCHVFRNYLTRRFDKLKAIDHGLTFKSYVTKNDMITEIEVAALQEFIVTSSKRHKPISYRGEFFKELCILNNRYSRPPMTKEEIAKRFRKEKRLVRKIGIKQLKNEFDNMVKYLKGRK